MIYCYLCKFLLHLIFFRIELRFLFNMYFPYVAKYTS